ncbi:MAG: CHAT domain-containing protein [Bacteroidia bacterium]
MSLSKTRYYFIQLGFLSLLLLNFAQAQEKEACDDLFWAKKVPEINTFEFKERREALYRYQPQAARCGQWHACISLTNGLTFIHFVGGDIDSAFFYSEKAYNIYQAHSEVLGDTAFPVINALNDYGAMQFYYFGNLPKGIALLERAAQTIEKIAQRNDISKTRLNQDILRTFHNLAVMYSRLGDFEEAKRVYHRVISIKESLPNPGPNFLAPSYGELGKVYMQTGEYEEAKVWLKKAFGTIQKMPTPALARESRYLTDLAQVQLALGEDEHARRSLERSRSRKQASTQAMNREILGRIDIKRGNYSKARDTLEAALEQALERPSGNQALIAKLYNLLADCALSQHKVQDALGYVQAGLAFLEGNPGSPGQLNYFPNIDSLNFPFEAITLLEQKASIANQLSELDEKERYKHNTQAYELALATCLKRIRSFRGEGSKIFWSEKMSSLVHRHIALQARAWQQNPKVESFEKALQAAEVLKAIVLREAITDARASQLSGVPQSLSDKVSDLKFSIIAQKRKLGKPQLKDEEKDSLSKTLFTQERQLKRAEDSLATFWQQSTIGQGLEQKISLSEIQKAMTADEQFLQFVMSDSSVYIFSIQKDQYQLHTIDDAVSIKAYIQDYVNMLKAPDAHTPAQVGELSAKLYQLLFAPLGSLQTKLTIIPDGIIFQLPFDALVTKIPQTDQYSQWAWVLNDHQIHYESSSTLWLSHKAEVAETHRDWIGLAPIRFGNGLPSLLESSAELEGVANALEGDLGSGSILEQQRASKSNFLHDIQNHPQAYSLIHFSTHAVSNGSFPSESWLAFHGEGDSAKLFLNELYAIPVRANMVVLSACETQAGKINKGEGIMSLARAFRYAGSKSIIATLWPTDEGVSRMVMTSFYTHIAEGLPKDKALQKARIAFLTQQNLPNDKMSPAYWAPFIATGEMAPLVESRSYWEWWVGGGLLLGLLLLRGLKRPRNSLARS